MDVYVSSITILSNVVFIHKADHGTKASVARPGHLHTITESFQWGGTTVGMRLVLPPPPDSHLAESRGLWSLLRPQTRSNRYGRRSRPAE